MHALNSIVKFTSIFIQPLDTPYLVPNGFILSSYF